MPATREIGPFMQRFRALLLGRNHMNNLRQEIKPKVHNNLAAQVRPPASPKEHPRAKHATWIFRQTCSQLLLHQGWKARGRDRRVSDTFYNKKIPRWPLLLCSLMETKLSQAVRRLQLLLPGYVFNTLCCHLNSNQTQFPYNVN